LHCCKAAARIAACCNQHCRPCQSFRSAYYRAIHARPAGSGSRPRNGAPCMQVSTDRDLDGAHKAAARQSLSGIPCTTALECHIKQRCDQWRGLRGPGPGNDCRFGHSGSPASKGFARQTGLRGASWGQVTSGLGLCGLSRLFRGVSPVSRNADLLRPARRIGRVSRHPNLRVVGPKSARVRRCEFQEGVEDRRGIHACLTRHNAGRARR